MEPLQHVPVVVSYRRIERRSRNVRVRPVTQLKKQTQPLQQDVLRGHDVLLAIPSLATVGLLIGFRRRFTVRSETRNIAQGFALVGASLLVAVAYGALGFWLLDRRDFGIQFHWQEAIQRSLRQYALLGNPDLVPNTRHARWFLDSLDVIGIAAALFAAFSLYRPLAYRLRTLPHERLHAAEILAVHGCSSIDHFKLAADKSFFFSSPHADAFIAYRAAWGVAVALGDPVGAPESLDGLLGDFRDHCAGNGWNVAFHQARPDLLELYHTQGLTALKIGEEAMVDLQTFATRTSVGSTFRRIRNRAAKLGLRVVRCDPPHPGALLDDMAAISTEWLSLPGRRERGFTLGQFDRSALAASPLFVVHDAADRALAFANQIPCWPQGDATIDLMRHRVEMPNGTMDVLFLEILLQLAKDFRRFSFGLAPLAGLADRPGAPLEERAMHQVYERLNRVFSYKGMRSYKAKFEPEYVARPTIGYTRVNFGRGVTGSATLVLGDMLSNKQLIFGASLNGRLPEALFILVPILALLLVLSALAVWAMYALLIVAWRTGLSRSSGRRGCGTSPRSRSFSGSSARRSRTTAAARTGARC